MKRALIFLVLAPFLVAVLAALGVAALYPMDRDCAKFLAVALFFFTLPVSALAGSLDAYLARAFTVPLRAPLIAVVGAIIASGLAFVLFSWILTPLSLEFFAIGGAACMGLCSLIANEYGWQQPVVHANSLLRN
jgi:hypothetical protein